MILLLALVTAGAIPVLAQAPVATIHIADVVGPNEVQGPANLPTMSMQMDFSMLDATGQVVRGAEVAEAKFVLDEGKASSAQIDAIALPWSIIVLVDSSKTMTGQADATFKDARFGAADALNALADGSNVAIMQYNNQPAIVQNFTKDKAVAQDALRKKIKANPAGNACMYDAALDAVNKLAAASGRHALLILAASADNCGTTVPGVVVNQAIKNHVQIFAVGLEGYTITDAQLQELTDPTHGIHGMRLKGDVIFAFENILNAMNLQFQAKGNLYPKAGNRTVKLEATLKDGTVISSAAVPFNSAKDFAQPPEVHFQGTVVSTRAGLEFNLTFVSVELIKSLQANIVNLITGNSEADVTLQEVRPDQKLNISVLTAGAEYNLVVTALDGENRAIGSETLKFKYEPALAQMNITNVLAPNRDDKEPAVVLTLQLANLEDAKQFQHWLVLDGTEIPLPGTVQTVPVASEVRVPVGLMVKGDYQAVLQAEMQDGTVLASVISPKFNYTPLTDSERRLRYIRETPAAIAGITVVSALTCVALLGVLWMVVAMVRPKQQNRLKAVDLALPEVKRRAAPVMLDSSPVRQAPEAARPPERQRRPEPRRETRAEPRPAAPARPPEPVRTADAIAPSGPVAASTGVLPKAFLAAHTPPDLKFAGNIGKSPFTIGRRDANDLVVKLDNRMGVSGRHATITYADGRFFIVDEKSTYGTLVNDTRIPAGTPTPLDDGALIGLGPKVKVQFRLNR